MTNHSFETIILIHTEIGYKRALVLQVKSKFNVYKYDYKQIKKSWFYISIWSCRGNICILAIYFPWWRNTIFLCFIPWKFTLQLQRKFVILEVVEKFRRALVINRFLCNFEEVLILKEMMRSVFSAVRSYISIIILFLTSWKSI